MPTLAQADQVLDEFVANYTEEPGRERCAVRR